MQRLSKGVPYACIAVEARPAHDVTVGGMVQELILARDGPECLGAGPLPTPRLRMQETISLAASLAYLAAVGMGNAAQIFDFESADNPWVQHHFQEQISAVALFTLPAEDPMVSHSCSASRALCRKLCIMMLEC